MTDDMPLPFDLPAVERKKLTVDFDGGNQSSDGGLLLLRQAERELGVCRRLADAMPDRRDQSRIRHAMVELVTARAFAIGCGYKDGNDLDRLRHDPLLKLAVGRRPPGACRLAGRGRGQRAILCSYPLMGTEWRESFRQAPLVDVNNAMWSESSA
jgi:Transposase DDE domain group 1